MSTKHTASTLELLLGEGSVADDVDAGGFAV